MKTKGGVERGVTTTKVFPNNITSPGELMIGVQVQGNLL